MLKYLKPIISVFNFEYFSTRCSASSFVLPYGFIGFLSASSVIGVSRDPENDEIGAANVNWRVQICQHIFGSGTAGV